MRRVGHGCRRCISSDLIPPADGGRFQRTAAQRLAGTPVDIDAVDNADPGDVVSGLLAAIESRSWDDFAGHMDESTIVIADHHDGSQLFIPWPEVMNEWKRAFAAVPPSSRRSAQQPAAVIEVAGSSAFISFGLGPGRSSKKRALVVVRLGDRWIVRHVYLSRLPPETPLPVTEQRQTPTEAFVSTREDLDGQPLFAALLSVALIAVARLGTLNAGEVSIETAAAIAAVFLGAVATLNRDLGPWFHGAEAGAVSDVPLAISGTLVVMVGAAFLVT